MSQAALPAVLCDLPSTAPITEKWGRHARPKAGAGVGRLSLGCCVG